METIIQILGVASIATLAQQTNWYKNTIFDRKPFNCTMCFTFWLTIGFYISLHGWHGIPYAALTAIAAEFIDRKLNQF